MRLPLEIRQRLQVQQPQQYGRQIQWLLETSLQPWDVIQMHQETILQQWDIAQWQKVIIPLQLVSIIMI